MYRMSFFPRFQARLSLPERPLLIWGTEEGEKKKRTINWRPDDNIMLNWMERRASLLAATAQRRRRVSEGTRTEIPWRSEINRFYWLMALLHRWGTPTPKNLHRMSFHSCFSTPLNRSWSHLAHTEDFEKKISTRTKTNERRMERQRRNPSFWKFLSLALCSAWVEACTWARNVTMCIRTGKLLVFVAPTETGDCSQVVWSYFNFCLRNIWVLVISKLC